MKEIKIDPNGDNLVVRTTFESLHFGSYENAIYDEEADEKLEKKPGNNTEPTDWHLSQEPSFYVGKHLNSVVGVVDPDGEPDEYRIRVTVYQGEEQRADHIFHQGQSNDTVKVSSKWGKFETL